MRKFSPFLFLLLSFNLYSQSYSELPNTGLENKSLGSIATGDLNNDGYLDVITTGIDESSELSTSVYINDQDGSFTKLDVILTPLYNSTIALGDYNKDGFLDILLAGEGYDPLSSLWKNNGDLTFTEVEVGLADLGGTNAEFRDIDNDGDLDILLSGSIRNENGSYSSDLRLYSNAGNDSFVELALSFTSYAVVGTLGDFDNDGDLDLLSGGGSLEIYPNNGDGTFSSPQSYGLFPAGEMKWFDFNNDGNLDFIISGRGFETDEYFTKVYQNVGADNGWFVELQGTDFANPRRGKLDIRDYNNDGNLDLLITGTLDFSTNSYVSKIYDNSGTSFTENSSVSLPKMGNGDGNWFDIDNDGDLDLILIGEEVQEANVKKTVVYRNDSNDNINIANSIPNAPSALSWTWANNITTFSWEAGSDNETTPIELSYNIGIGTNAEASDILFPESNSDGRRLIQKLGNAQNRQEKLLIDMKNGIYYVKVQSIDGALAGSEFSESKIFAVGIPTAPSNASAAIDSNEDIVITWTDNSVNEFSFVIEQKSNIEDNYSEVGSTNTNENSFSIASLEDAIYTFRIKAVNPNGESDYIEANDVAVGIPTAPSNASAAIDSNEDIVITWTDNSVNEFSFVIEQKSNIEANYNEVGSTSTNENSFSIESLEDAIYTFRIKAVNPNGESDYIEANDVAVGTPTAPSNFSAVLNDGSILLSWDDVVNERSYKLDRSSNNSESFEELASLEMDMEEYLDEDLAPGTYTYRLQAINENGESDYVNSDLSIEIVLGVANPEKSNFSIYPNPVFNDFVYIKTSDGRILSDIQINDLAGRVLDLPITNFNHLLKIDFTKVQSGVYIINAKEDGTILSQRIIIE